MHVYTKKSSKKSSKKYIKTQNVKKQYGGAVPGTTGNFNTLVADIEALAKSIGDTIINTVELIVDVVELPGDVGKAYNEPAAQLLKS